MNISKREIPIPMSGDCDQIIRIAFLRSSKGPVNFMPDGLMCVPAIGNDLFYGIKANIV